MTRAPRQRIASLLAALLLTLAALLPATAAAACPKTSLPAIEGEVMCPICGVPLVNAGGQQAENEREFIRDRVERCESKEQIKAALVSEYGEEVLALPGNSGFDLAAYVVPIAGIGVAAIALAAGALRWRRARGAPDDQAQGAHATGHGTTGEGSKDAEDNSALDADLRRYDL